MMRFRLTPSVAIVVHVGKPVPDEEREPCPDVLAGRAGTRATIPRAITPNRPPKQPGNGY
jgi:hypothetical protein